MQALTQSKAPSRSSRPKAFSTAPPGPASRRSTAAWSWKWRIGSTASTTRSGIGRRSRSSGRRMGRMCCGRGMTSRSISRVVRSAKIAVGGLAHAVVAMWIPQLDGARHVKFCAAMKLRRLPQTPKQSRTALRFPLCCSRSPGLRLTVKIMLPHDITSYTVTAKAAAVSTSPINLPPDATTQRTQHTLPRPPRPQRRSLAHLLLQWVQENIATFEGDPRRVTIQGESAGGTSIGAMLLAFGGRDDGLFTGAVAESGPPARVSSRVCPSADTLQC